MTHVKMKYSVFILMAVLFTLQPAFGKITVPKLLGDGMVLQRDATVKLWGWASAHERITIKFRNAVYKTTATDSGTWEVKLPPIKAGGPYTMTLSGEDTITIRNILFGDVWICSGQSNMELPMRRVRPLYEHEIVTADNDYVRWFMVPQRYNFNAPQLDVVSGSWQPTNSKTILGFSATAYFFAQALYERYHVPIGLIQTALGGSPAQAWMSEEALKMFPDYEHEARRFKDSTLIVAMEQADRTRMEAWYKELGQKDIAYKDSQKVWFDPTYTSSDWKTMNIPGYWATAELGPVNGAVWFKKEITIDPSQSYVNTDSQTVGRVAKLHLGRIVDADSVFVNGVFVGSTGYQYPPRRYEFSPAIIHEGKNTIVVKVISTSGQGGFVLDKPYELIVGGRTYDLKGMWQYRLGATMEPLADQTFVQWKPVGLFNAMISPLVQYSMKGVIWYQGESNAEKPQEYQNLFPALIRDWRKKWNQGNYPFLFVQLPNYMQAQAQPSESNWALFREVQRKTLSLPNTGMAVTIDIGEWNDIHPLDKKDVGKRLALTARNVAYHEKNVVYSGPRYRSMKIHGNKMILSFDCVGSGLIAANVGELDNFAVAGSDKRFVWAKAKIKRNTVEVWNDEIRTPVTVRYAWADNPTGVKLYNREGLPASPFSTDDNEVNRGNRR